MDYQKSRGCGIIPVKHIGHKFQGLGSCPGKSLTKILIIQTVFSIGLGDKCIVAPPAADEGKMIPGYYYYYTK